MSDQKKADEQKPIQDETLDKVSGGAGSDYIIIHNPIDRSLSRARFPQDRDNSLRRILVRAQNPCSQAHSNDVRVPVVARG